MTTSLLCTPWIFTGSTISQVKSFCEINTTINSILYLPVQDPNSTPLMCKSRSSVSCASFIDRNRFSTKSLYNMNFILHTYCLWSCCCVSAPTLLWALVFQALIRFNNAHHFFYIKTKQKLFPHHSFSIINLQTHMVEVGRSLKETITLFFLTIKHTTEIFHHRSISIKNSYLKAILWFITFKITIKWVCKQTFPHVFATAKLREYLQRFSWVYKKNSISSTWFGDLTWPTHCVQFQLFSY